MDSGKHRINSTGVRWIVDEKNRPVGYMDTDKQEYMLPSALDADGIDKNQDLPQASVSGDAGAESGTWDYVVYGATPSGIMSACTAAAQGLSVLLVAHDNRIGGMMTGGLIRTDYRGYQPGLGWNTLSLEFNRRCAGVLGMTLSEYASIMVSPLSARPSVYLRVFKEMLTAYGVRVLTGYRLKDINTPGYTPVRAQAQRIVSCELQHMTTADVKQVQGRYWCDASYEADLLMHSGVSFFVGREANATYAEDTNGVRTLTGIGSNLSPYVVAGDPASGLLPRFDPTPIEAAGTSDSRIQAYGYRLVVTSDPDDKIPFPEPETYDLLEVELLRRRIAQSPGDFQTLESVFEIGSNIPGGVLDLNNKTLTLDYPGGNVGYPSATYAQRAEMERKHINYTLTLLKFLREHPDVPQALRNIMAAYGFSRSEFVSDNTTGMSPALYIRESARMVGEYIMTQQNAEGTRVPNGYPISLATYPLDCHGASLRINASGFAAIEGGLSGHITPTTYYGVPLQALLPKQHECRNLVVTCNGISASHVAFCGLRLEHGFMGFGEAGGAAVAISAQTGRSLHNISGNEVARIVRGEHYYPYSTLLTMQQATGGIVPVSGTEYTAPGRGKILTTGNWADGAAKGPVFHAGTMYHDNNGGKGGRKVKFYPAFATAGKYMIRLNAPADNASATSSMVSFRINIRHAAGNTGITTLYRKYKSGEWFWRPLGSWEFNADGLEYVEIINEAAAGDSTSGFLMLDGVAWELVIE